MKPSDLSLPPKFAKWQRFQEEAIVAAACADERFTILQAPPGVGKSAIYMGVASLVGGRTLALTMTKPLQAQLYSDFSSMGLKELKGQNNYPCLYFDDGKRKVLPGCDEGPCHAGIDCDLKEGGCKYYDAVRRAAASDMVVENYTHWMTLNRFSEPGILGHFDTLICDEAHEANDALAEFVKVSLDRHKVEKLLGCSLPYSASMEEWVEWATEEGLPRCRARLESAKGTTALFQEGITAVRAISDLQGNILDLTKARGWKRTDAADPAAWLPGTSNDWVVEEDNDKVTFQPVWASGYAEDYLFSRIPRVILVSATVTPKDAHYLGIFKDQVKFLQYPSPFNRDNRPLFVVPTVKVGRSITPGEERIWLKQIDRIVQREAVDKGLKGIVHAVSYERALKIKEHSIHGDLMIIHDKRNLRATVDRFKAMSGPAVLISPSVGTGYDFKGDQCRFQIVAKIPFINHQPAVIRARSKLDRDYLNHVALVALIQMVGRGVRSTDDWCRTYLIDDNWYWFGRSVRNMMPKWFKAAVKKVNRLSEVA